jgi:hypothetical protein
MAPVGFDLKKPWQELVPQTISMNYIKYLILEENLFTANI